jgi:hypothetical protein
VIFGIWSARSSSGRNICVSLRYLASGPAHGCSRSVAAPGHSPGSLQAAGAQSGTVEYRVANVMDYDPHADGPWDLVVMSETIYYLGWLYPFFDVGWLAFQLFEATREGGRLLMANTCGGVEDYLLRPWLIRTYRDLFLNVGYGLEAEEALRGTKDDVPLEVLISVFVKHPEQAVGGS